MKVAIVIPNFYPAVVYGGWVYSSYNTCKEMASLGIASYVSTTNDNGPNYLPANTKEFVKLQEDIFVKYYPQTIRERLSVPMAFQLWKDIRNADVVHIQGIFSAPTPIGLLYAALFRKKVLLSPHGCLGSWCLADGSKFKKLYLRLFIRPYARQVLWHVTSQQEKEEITALFPDAKTQIIPNGIYVEEFSSPVPISRKEMLLKYTGFTTDPEKIVVSMSRLHRKKGLDILIRAFHLVTADFPTAVLLIAGEDFGEKNVLENIVSELQLEKHVFFVGQLQHQARVDFFANADVFALSSHNENFGLVFAEAMAAGTPVVASRFTPWSEVEELRIGKWVTNTPKETAQGIVEVLQSDHKAMGKAARQFVAQSYSWQSIGKQFKQVFTDMLPRHR